MYKLKNTYIDKMITSRLSKSEIAFILHIACSQDESGRVYSVYYKDVCYAIDISVQKFYDILQSLSDKKLITYEKQNPADFVVQLVGNDFRKKDFKEGYLNVASKDFRNKKFVTLKAGAQLLYLYTQRLINGKHMFVQKFYEEFCKLFGVTRKTLQIYLQQLKEAHYLFISKKRNKAYHYEMTMKKSTCLDKKGILPNEKSFYVDNIKKLIQANFGKYIKDEKSEKARDDIADLAITKRADKYHNFVPAIVVAIKISISNQKKEKKKNILINAALVNKCLSEAIERFWTNTCVEADKEIIRLLTANSGL